MLSPISAHYEKDMLNVEYGAMILISFHKEIAQENSQARPYFLIPDF